MKAIVVIGSIIVFGLLGMFIYGSYQNQLAQAAKVAAEATQVSIANDAARAQATSTEQAVEAQATATEVAVEAQATAVEAQNEAQATVDAGQQEVAASQTATAEQTCYVGFSTYAMTLVINGQSAQADCISLNDTWYRFNDDYGSSYGIEAIWYTTVDVSNLELVCQYTGVDVDGFHNRVTVYDSGFHIEATRWCNRFA